MELTEACRRLGEKGIFTSPAESFSVLMPGGTEMQFASGSSDWRQLQDSDVRLVALSDATGIAALHAMVYRLRMDAEAVAISSPPSVRLLGRAGGYLPPLFDEQVRNLGVLAQPSHQKSGGQEETIARALEQGANAVQLGEQVLCLGMNCEHAVGNAELYDKCARAYLLARSSGQSFRRIPAWVRWIATSRLRKEQRGSRRSAAPPRSVGSASMLI